jgi:hypothetical protein
MVFGAAIRAALAVSATVALGVLLRPAGARAQPAPARAESQSTPPDSRERSATVHAVRGSERQPDTAGAQPAVPAAPGSAPESLSPVSEEPLPDQPPIGDDQKREVPDYDGRGADPTTPGEIALWLPRILLSPLYLVSEYLVRQPLGWVVTKAEQEDLPAILVDLFTFGPENQAGLVPTTLIDFGFKPSVGLFFFWNDAVVDDNDLRVRAATWGPDWITASLSNRTEFWKTHEIAVRGGFLRRPDWVFHGLGPESGGDRARFSETRADVAVEYDARLWRSSVASAFVGLCDASFDGDTGCCGDPTVNQAAAAGRFPVPPGFTDGYTITRSGVSLVLDSRRPRNLEAPVEGSDHVSPPGDGLRLAVRGEHGAGLRDAPRTSLREPLRYNWVKYGATLGGFVDVDNQQRVLGLSLIADFAEPLWKGSQIPFTEQVGLGGERPLRGFLHGRLWDHSAAVAKFEYTWPIWVWLDATLHYAVGNVFGSQLEGFEWELLRQSFGIGFRATNAREHAFEVLTAFGTETFDQGAAVDTFRFVFGASSGF